MTGKNLCELSIISFQRTRFFSFVPLPGVIVPVWRPVKRHACTSSNFRRSSRTALISSFLPMLILEHVVHDPHPFYADWPCNKSPAYFLCPHLASRRKI